MVMNLTESKPVVYTTKRREEAPFRNELFLRNASHKLIRASRDKTYPVFIKDCKSPNQLLEIIQLKQDDRHFPRYKKIQKVFLLSAAASTILMVFGGRRAGKKFVCWVLKAYIPKRQYAHA